MKVGVLTFHRAHNYGAILQCYAMQEWLRNEGFEVKVIDYEPSWMKEAYHYWNKSRFNLLHPIAFILAIFDILKRYRRYKSFNHFIKSMLYLSDKKRLNYIIEDFDCVVIGSDQVWNTEITQGIDYYYWGKFRRGRKPIIISYASSMGTAIEKIEQDSYIQVLKNFDFISSREISLQVKLGNILNVHIPLVVDPTLLLGMEFWNTKVVNVDIKEPYLFFYQALADEKAYQYARSKARALGLKFVCLSAAIYSHNTKDVIYADPIKFISLFKSATYIITTSFHGTVFSLLFKKRFSSLLLGYKGDDRIISLLNYLGLSSYLTTMDKDINMLDIDWKKIDVRMSNFIEDSKKYLLLAINSMTVTLPT